MPDEMPHHEILDTVQHDEQKVPSFWDKHRLSLLLVLATAATLVFTVVSVGIYTISGAAQLDLSRPGYKSVSSQVEGKETIDEYSASGEITEETIREFLQSYSKQADKATSVDAFNGDPLNPELLQLAPRAE